MKRIEPLEPRRLLTTLTLDPSFSGDGRVSLDTGSYAPPIERAHRVAIDAEGRLLVVGGSTIGSTYPEPHELVRYTAAGAFDTSFDVGGATVDDVTIQPDGKIVVAVRNGSSVYVERYTATGEADWSFYVQGYPAADEERAVLATSADGTTYLALNTSDNVAIYEIGEYGSYVDVATVWQGFGEQAQVTDLEIDANGDILVLGNTSRWGLSGSRPFLARFDAVGVPDMQFGDWGRMTLESSWYSYLGRSLLITAANDYVVAGSSGHRAALWKVSDDGGLDPQFGTYGRAVATASQLLNTDSSFNDVVLVNDRLVAAGSVGTDTTQDHLFGVFSLNGQPDTTFDADGIRVDAFAQGEVDGAEAMAVDAAGRIVVVGATTNVTTQTSVGTGRDWSIARYTMSTQPVGGTVRGVVFQDTNGSGGRNTGEPGIAGRTVWLDLNDTGRRDAGDLVTTTSADGSYRFDNLPAGSYLVNQIVPAGSKFAAVTGDNFTWHDVAEGATVTIDFGTTPIAANAGLDSSFGNNGVSAAVPNASQTAFTDDGKLIAYRVSPNYSVSLERYSATGVLEATLATFSSSGATGLQLYPTRILVRPDGRILLIGSASNNSGLAAVQFTASGSLDSSFGTGGRLTITTTGGTELRGAAFDSNGRVILSRAASGSILVSAYTANGVLDTTFGAGGTATTPRGSSINVGAMFVAPDGRVYQLSNESGLDARITRLTASGATDTTFGTNGTAILRLEPAVNNRINLSGLTFLPDGRILAAGSRLLSGEVQRFCVVRLASDGTLDTSFGQAGYAVAAFQRQSTVTSSAASQIVLLPSGGFYALGTASSTVSRYSDVAIACFNADGQLRTSWGDAGRRTLAFGIDSDRVQAARVANDGRLTAAVSWTDASTEMTAVRLVRWVAPVIAASISGTLFNDLDNDGVRDANEPGIAGRTVYLDANNNGTYQSTSETAVTTDANGVYRFESLAAGSYNVRQIVPSGWVQTRPQSGWTHTVTLTTGQQSTNNDLGVRGTAATTVVSSAFTFETAMRFTMTFDDSVVATLSADDVSVAHFATGFITTLPTSLWTLSVIGSTAIVTLSNAVPDANYQVRIRENGFAGSNGVFNSSPFFSPTFGVLAGDINRDRTVNFDDLLLLAKNYGKTGQTFSQGNVDYSADGTIGFDDLLVLAQRYGKSIPAAAAAADTAATAGSLVTTATRKRSTASEIV